MGTLAAEVGAQGVHATPGRRRQGPDAALLRAGLLGLAGASTAWFATGLLLNPVFGLPGAIDAAPVAVPVAALVAALSAWWPPAPALALVVLPVGSLLAQPGDGESALVAAIFGALSAVLLAPLAAFLERTERRACAARAGSVVANAHCRASVILLATFCGLTTLPGALDWAPASVGLAEPPWSALAVVAASVAAVAILLALHVRARARTRVVADALENNEAPRAREASAPEASPRRASACVVIDLGLGDHARPLDPRATYRRAPSAARVVGDPDAALHELGATIRSAVGQLGLLAVVGAAHAAGSTDAATDRYTAWTCEHHPAGRVCYVAALRAKTQTRARIFHELACKAGVRESCDWLRGPVDPPTRL